MARHTTLVKLLDMYRAECHMSFNPAHNAQDRDRQVHHLQRVQDWLWEDFAWPMLRVYRTLTLQKGQRYYSLPADIHIDRIQKVEIFMNNVFLTMQPGIGIEHLSAYNSDLGVEQWPPRRWQISEDEQFEVWPISNTDGNPTTLEGIVRITAIKNLSPLVDDGDRCDLDGRLITLFAASEYLASKGDKGAQLKLDQANKLYTKLRGSQTPRNKFKMFGIDTSERVERVPFAVYNKPS